jgi:myb proto-oncogene protein
MGIDPVTHKPKNDALLSNDGQSKNAANLSHMAQWESARLEAEARLVRESKLRSSHSFQHHQLGNPAGHASSSSASTSAHLLNKTEVPVFYVKSSLILKVNFLIYILICTLFLMCELKLFLNK